MNTLRFAFCFDRSYALPAAVSLHSLLVHAATPDATYELNIIAGDLGEHEEEMLRRIAAPFPKAVIKFHKPPALPDSLRGAVSRKSHYSDALFHKLLLPRLFEPEGRIVALDVDTVYLGDVAEFHAIQFDGCVAGAREPLYWGWRGEGPAGPAGKGSRHYERKYSDAERRRMTLNAGIIIYDLAKIAAQRAVEKWMVFALANADRLMLPEQDVFNLALDAPPAPLPWNVCTYAPFAPHPSLLDPATIQIHYTTKVKPWMDPSCNLADKWYEALAAAGLVEEWRRFFAEASRGMYRENYASRIFALNIGRLRLSLVKFRKPKH